jgi:hypothetical protein
MLYAALWGGGLLCGCCHVVAGDGAAHGVRFSFEDTQE